MRKCKYSPDKDCPFFNEGVDPTLNVCIACWKITTEQLQIKLKNGV